MTQICPTSHYQALEAEDPEKASSRFKSPANLQSATLNPMNIFKRLLSTIKFCCITGYGNVQDVQVKAQLQNTTKKKKHKFEPTDQK